MDANTCCPPFDPAPWDGAVQEWKDKRFIKDRVFCFCHIPITFGKVIVRMLGKVEAAHGEMPGWLCLSDHTSRWNMDLYLAVDREIPGAENVTLSGRHVFKVYEGPYKDTGKWCKDFETYVRGRQMNIEKLYMWYTTCPKCARKYGKNYVVLIARTA